MTTAKAPETAAIPVAGATSRATASIVAKHWIVGAIVNARGPQTTPSTGERHMKDCLYFVFVVCWPFWAWCGLAWLLFLPLWIRWAGP